MCGPGFRYFKGQFFHGRVKGRPPPPPSDKWLVYVWQYFVINRQPLFNTKRKTSLAVYLKESRKLRDLVKIEIYINCK